MHKKSHTQDTCFFYNHKRLHAMPYVPVIIPFCVCITPTLIIQYSVLLQFHLQVCLMTFLTGPGSWLQLCMRSWVDWPQLQCQHQLSLRSLPEWSHLHCEHSLSLHVEYFVNIFETYWSPFEAFLSCTIYRVVSVTTTVPVLLDGRVRTVILIPTTVS